MLLSEDKASHLSHVILKALKASKLARLNNDETQALREIKRVLAEQVLQEEEIDRIVRSRLASYSRSIFEGSAEWDALYRKTFEEEARRKKKPTS